ncbi:fumarylacetoacetate hydrolase family protein [Paramicrobacterium chengjingii]|uniref:fumarylacetoacetate hydrolase family protein n=1 Tax=Paramicrobacterium chengjingii TaxID=2769067 RepID=UPI001F42AA3C|nr:fumarylacetoacetate hydrolase family protein [Microbacterium chengjingii]
MFDDQLAIDVQGASDGRFSSDPQAIYAQWREFCEWADSSSTRQFGVEYDPRELGPAVPRPPQVFAIGLNYASHADESGFRAPENPVVFTKYVSSFTGADVDVVLTGERVDWEAELVVVIGQGGRDIPEAESWSHVAGLAVGQDLSDRTIQFWGNPPQFSLGKSLAGFTPLGPWVASLDEVATTHNINALGIRCVVRELDGTERVLQDGNSRHMIFPVPALVARLSAVVELFPGDVIFTGTPAGVGIGREPQEFLRAGQSLRTEIDGIGTVTQRFIGPTSVIESNG